MHNSMASNGKSRNKKDPYPYNIQKTKNKVHYNIQIACKKGKLRK